MNRGKNSPTFLATKQSQIKICVLFFFLAFNPLLLLFYSEYWRVFYIGLHVSSPFTFQSLIPESHETSHLFYIRNPQFQFTFNCRRVDGRNLRLGPAYFASFCSFTVPSTEPLAEQIPCNYCLTSTINGWVQITDEWAIDFYIHLSNTRISQLICIPRV